MGASVQPVSIDDDLKAIRAKAKPRDITRDLARIRGDTGDIVLPKTAADDTSVAPGEAKPGLLRRAGSAIAETASDLYHHPSHLITEPVKAGFDALLTPVQGSEASGIGGRGGKATLPAGQTVTTENTPGAITPERQKAAGVETVANVALPGVAGKLGRLIAPKAGEFAGEVIGRVGANAAAGAATNPSDPIVGAATGVTTGEALHHTIERGVKAAVPSEAPQLRIERRSTPSENRPVWTQAERDAYHAEQTAAYDAGLKNWQPGQPTPRLTPPTHPDVIAAQIQKGKTQPFPYQTAAELADNEVQHMHSGIGLNPETAKSVKDVVNSALYSPAAAIRESHPDLTAAGEAAISAPANARHIGQVQTKWVTEGVSPEAAQAFLPQLQLDRLNHMLQRDPSLLRNDAFAENLSDLQSRVPQGFHETPEFKQMAERYRNGILSQTEQAAASAGLKPEQFADLPNGYARLVPSENAPEGTFADYVGGTGPKKGPATRLTTAQSASGMGAYTNSLVETVTQDALDKIVKARHNEFYQQLLKEGTVLEDPKATVPEGQAKVSFDDKGNVISDPSQAKITLSVPKDVALYAKHVFKTLNEPGATTPAALAMKSASHAAGGLALLANPAAATSHSLTLANTVGTVPEVGKPLNNLVGVVPGGTTAKGAFDIATVDRTTPETRALESRLSKIGALRPEMDHPTEGMGKTLKDLRDKLGPLGKVLSPHEILFGEDGIDKRSRIALAEKYIQAAKARDIPVTDAGLREFVVSKAGDYIKGNAGALVNHLQDSNLSLFARMGVTRVTNAAKSAVGKSGLPEATRGQKAADIAATLARGAVGYGVGLTALNYYLSGHSPLSNEPGHMSDLEYGTDERGKKKYIRGAILNPLVSTAMRSGGESIIRGDPAGVVKDATNTALGVATSHPLVRGVTEATTGRTPYIERDGSMMRTVPPELSSGDQVTGRLKAAGRDMTAAGQFLGAGQEKNPGVPGGKALSYLAPPITATASPGGESRIKAQSAKDWLDDRVMQTYRAGGDTEKQKQIIEQALEDAKKFNAANKDDQVTLGLVNKELRKAAAKANANVHRPNRLVRPVAQ